MKRNRLISLAVFSAISLSLIGAIAAPEVPTVDGPADVSVECASHMGTEVTLTATVGDADGDALTVTWSVDGVDVHTEQVPASGPPTAASVSFTHTYPMGNSAVVVTVSDGSAAASASSTVSVVDTTPPAVDAGVALSSLWPPNHNLTTVGLSAVIHDICDPHPQVWVEVYGDEDDEMAAGDGRHSPDARNIALSSLRLRSERRGDADGRVYLIVVKARDESGNVGFDATTVVVPHSNSRAAHASVAAQASAALNWAMSHGGNPPAGFFVVGDGPVLGPKQ